MITAPGVFGAAGASPDSDPCPGYRKYVEVAFKCRPTQFRSKSACAGEAMKLDCGEREGTRLAVYSSAFASAEGSHIYCEAPQAAGESSSDGVTNKYDVSEMKKCEESSAATTESVMDLCHGKGEHCCSSLLQNGESW